MAKKQFDIWSEGYACTGEAGPAFCLGTYYGNSFKEACDSLAKTDPGFAKYYDPKRLTYWGCKLFDNETDARKTFG